MFLWKVVIDEFPELSFSVSIFTFAGGFGALAVFEGNTESSFSEIRKASEFSLAMCEIAGTSFFACSLDKNLVTF